MKKFDNYYLGLDIGTSSVGWAVTDSKYDVLKFNGKHMWGTRLFPEAKTAEERRVHRSSRRRLKRQKERIQILQMFFAEEITKIDPGFFQRLKDSKYYIEDKKENQKNSLFNDKNYKDKDYHKDFPTIYHLRKYLLEGNKPKDIRFLYLAIHHIFMHRGHFLFPDMEVQKVTDFLTVFKELKEYLYNELELDFDWKSGTLKEVEGILKDRNLSKSEKERKLLSLVQIDGAKIDKQRQAIVGMLCGCKKKFADLFQNEEYKEIEPNSFSFSESSYEEKRDELETLLGDDIVCLDYLKSIYDWGKLSDILQGEKSISIAKVKSYEEHQKNLKDLKYLLKEYCSEERNKFFREKTSKVNYVAYINGIVTQEDLNKSIKKILEKIEKNMKGKDKKLYADLFLKSQSGLLFPKQVVKDNGVIPYQIHRFELEMILKNMTCFFPMLDEKSEGKTTLEKLILTFNFRIPYYVGPLNASHERAWIVKKTEGKIYPWNFEEKVNLEESAEKFIKNLTNKCTYLPMEDVLPKSSLLYSKFLVLNELNNLKLNGEPVSILLKEKIYHNLFEKHKKVTQKKLRNYLKSENIKEDVQITGIDGDFKSSLSSYIDFSIILGEKIKNDSVKKMVEKCIYWISLYTGEKKLLKNKILAEYKDSLSKEEVQRIVNLKYKDWGRLSYAFLQEIQSPSLETGEMRNIIQSLSETNYNLMELLSSKFSFLAEVEERNSSIEKKEEFSYENLLNDSYTSPPVRRMIWQSLRIVEEIKKITKKAPEKIFIEMARQGEKKKERKESRKNNLIQLYKAIKDDKDWEKELEATADVDFRRKSLYLYYTQMGKCMYSGDSIPLLDLDKKNLYDIDHIFPRSKTKDDSIENLVLVKKDLNAKKEDGYPVNNDIQKKQKDFWSFLHSKKLIGDKKYERLMRTTEFTDEELSNFIARQLVETRQSTKLVAEILQQLLPETKIVYVKAGLTSDFRKHFTLVKARNINDFHHAHDAYLNIITGNVYNTKFTDNPRNFIKEKKEIGRKYNLTVESIFKGGKKDAEFWNPDTMLLKIKDYIFQKRPQFTRYSFEQHGGLFNQNIVGKESCKTGSGYIPVKLSDDKILDTSKYGGYGSITGTYFFLVEHTVKGERVRSIEILPLYLVNRIKGKENLEKYCCEDLGLSDPEIRYEKIKYNSLLKINGYPYHITGKTNDSYWITGAVQPLFSQEQYEYLRKASIFLSEGRLDKEINAKENKKILTCMIEKLENTIYRKKMGSIIHNRIGKNLAQILKEEENKFSTFPLKEQLEVIFESLTLMQANNFGANLKQFGSGQKCGITKIHKNIDKLDEIILINQSVTGLFENEIDLKKV